MIITKLFQTQRDKTTDHRADMLYSQDMGTKKIIKLINRTHFS